MSVFDLIRILHAMHFILGIPIAGLYLRFLIFNPILTVATHPELSWSDAIRSVLFGGFILLWYFVWYGSIVFALFRRFPIFSIRLFSLLLLIVYAGWIVFLSVQSDNPWDRAMENPLYPLALVVMLLLGLTGVTVLPRLKTTSDAEEEALLESEDLKIDEQRPWQKSE
jgi:hypothetical protein